MADQRRGQGLGEPVAADRGQRPVAVPLARLEDRAGVQEAHEPAPGEAGEHGLEPVGVGARRLDRVEIGPTEIADLGVVQAEPVERQGTLG